MGCYEDQGDRMMEKLKWGSSGTNSPQTCGEACRDYKYFSNQNGGECWCSNTLKREIKKPDSECNSRCPGDNTKFCGGYWRNSVYQREAQGNDFEINYQFFICIYWFYMQIKNHYYHHHHHHSNNYNHYNHHHNNNYNHYHNNYNNHYYYQASIR